MLCRDLIGLMSLFDDCFSGALSACCLGDTCVCRLKQCPG